VRVAPHVAHRGRATGEGVAAQVIHVVRGVRIPFAHQGGETAAARVHGDATVYRALAAQRHILGAVGTACPFVSGIFTDVAENVHVAGRGDLPERHGIITVEIADGVQSDRSSSTEQ